MSGPYMSVPNPGNHSPGEADLGADRPTSYMSEGSILNQDGNLLGAHTGPAPSIMSRDSTYSSLAAPSITGARSSWGSSKALATSEGPIAGAEYGRPRVGSNLAYSSPFPDDDEEQGHIQPNAAVPATDKEVPVWAGGPVPKKRKSRALFWAILLAIVLILIGVGLGVGLGIAKPWDKNHAGSANDHSNNGNEDSSSSSQDSTDHKTENGQTPTTSDAPKPSESVAPKPTWGGQGSIITLADGTNMTYDNPFGGYWVYDEQNPLNNSAKCNSWTPALDEEWDWNNNKIWGVNLGGWLNTEPFIVPGLFEDHPDGPAGPTVDEYTLSINLGDKLESVMRNHYETFITERDFAEIASAGLNYIRLPIAHWAIQTWDGEPFLEKVSWEYVLKAFQWARKYGLRINLDLHTVPGSQNGWNHSGRLGLTNFLNGPMGLANAQRALDVIRTIAQFISQPEWAPVVPIFGFINEPNGAIIGQDAIASFYLEAYREIRAVTGVGKGPMLSMHDGFVGLNAWNDFARGADRLMIDQHPYLVFNDQMGTDPEQFKYRPCERWAAATNQTSMRFGPNNAGEWSAAVNDCGQWVNGVGLGTRFEGTYEGFAGKGIGKCDMWNDYRLWDSALRQTMLTYVSGSMDALQNYFFWTWKIGNSSSTIPEPNAMWHYRLGLREGWIPKDPRSVAGTCTGAGGQASNPFYTFTADWMTGGGSANQAVETGNYAWPPTLTSYAAADMARVPQYTPTGTPVVAAGPTYTAPGAQKAFDFGSGWANNNDNSRRAFVEISGCSYPDRYTAASGAIPNNACGAGLPQPTKRSLNERAPVPGPTPAP